MSKEQLNPVSFEEQIITGVDQLFEYDIRNNNYKKGVDLIEQGFIPVKISNHQSLSDAVVDVHLSEDFRKIPNNQIEGVDIIIADSLSEKRQSEGSKKAFEIFYEYIKGKEWLELLSVAYINDVKKMFHPLEIKKIIKALSENKMMIIYPEGRTEGGRPKKGSSDADDVNGMIPAQNIDKILENYLKQYQKGEVKFFIWPIAISNSYKVLSPVDYQLYSGQINSPLAKVNFGKPISPERLSEIDDKTFYIMIKIAEMLPENQKGVYNRHVLSTIS